MMKPKEVEKSDGPPLTLSEVELEKWKSARLSIAFMQERAARFNAQMQLLQQSAALTEQEESKARKDLRDLEQKMVESRGLDFEEYEVNGGEVRRRR